ncbi:hypothetical protein HHL22_06695 [Hymenobacter sp. RP-2-7]|uniref:Uncharacterized protein n=1 Tax=Hymenobacter polaris TaxID=2682546 RepID=A0A7Y0FLX8_9BACT|nr:hypothetical protein [Hymenobacter polaris]NML64891.1 hypothetical protein [Hymenobacter polaris]
MTNEQATELLALVADQLKATDRLNETFNRRFEQLTEVVLNGFVRLEDKFDKKIDVLTGRVDVLTDHVDVLTDEMREVKADVRDIKSEAQTTNRRLQATFEQTGKLTESNTDKEARIVKLETEAPSNAELHRRLLALEEQMRRAS